jgi:DDE family transposase
VTLDLDATLVGHHGPVGSRQGTRGTYTGKIAWLPLLCFVGETGEWLHGKLGNGHAGASGGGARFLVECLDRVPAGVPLYLRADEGFWGQDFFAELERRGITYAVGAPQMGSVKALERDPGERVAAVELPARQRGRELRLAAEDLEAGAALCRPPRPDRGRRATAPRRGDYHYYVLVSNDHERSADELECWHRAKANVENRIKEAKLGFGLDNLPCRGFRANWAYLLVTLLAYNLLCWLKLLALPHGERSSYAKRLRFRFINGGRHGRTLRPPPDHPGRRRVPAAPRLRRGPATDPCARLRACLTSSPRHRQSEPLMTPTAEPPPEPLGAPSTARPAHRAKPPPPRDHLQTAHAPPKRPPQPLTAGSG